MPTYDYKCFDCQHQFEASQKISEPAIDKCPSCGKEGNVKRLISATAFHLKGSGWYKTDYASSSTASNSTTPSSTPSTSSETTSSESSAAPSTGGSEGSSSGSEGSGGGSTSNSSGGSSTASA